MVTFAQEFRDRLLARPHWRGREVHHNGTESVSYLGWRDHQAQPQRWTDRLAEAANVQHPTMSMLVVQPETPILVLSCEPSRAHLSACDSGLGGIYRVRYAKRHAVFEEIERAALAWLEP